MESAFSQLRNLKATTRIHLLKENTMESDELTEVLNNLAGLVENFKQIAGDSDQSEDEEDMDEEDDY